MPKWKEKCIKFELQRDLPDPTSKHKRKQTRTRILQICLPSSSTISSTLRTITAPARNPYFYLWLFLSWISTDLGDGIQLEGPLADIYDFLKGGTEIAGYLREVDVVRLLGQLIGSPLIAWLLFLGWPPENLNPAFESLAYYDDWFAAYRLARIAIPDVWGLAKSAIGWLFRAIDALLQATFIILVLVPFATFNFFVVREVSPVLAAGLHQAFERNIKVWETHFIQPLICLFLVSSSSASHTDSP
ncbi:hypothetical protein TWF696_000789 [Orbilia brochopaga]|uniref:Uncharacterized protein n=1 Tax=Orbilia brochopaga TaxID=3140254 RepID=A0AAV9VCF1_9PEZI